LTLSLDDDVVAVSFHISSIMAAVKKTHAIFTIEVAIRNASGHVHELSFYVC